MNKKRIIQSICIGVFTGCLLLVAFGIQMKPLTEDESGWIALPQTENVAWQTDQQLVELGGKTYMVQVLTCCPKNTASDLRTSGSRWRACPDEEQNVVQQMLTEIHAGIKAFFHDGLYSGAGVVYSYQADETISFIYVKDQGADHLELSHVSSKCEVEVAYMYSQLLIEDGDAYPNIVQDKIEFSQIPDGYSDVGEAIQAHRESRIETAFAEDMNLTGVDGQDVKTVHLLSPKRPGQIW